MFFRDMTANLPVTRAQGTSVAVCQAGGQAPAGGWIVDHMDGGPEPKHSHARAHATVT